MISPFWICSGGVHCASGKFKHVFKTLFFTVINFLRFKKRETKILSIKKEKKAATTGQPTESCFSVFQNLLALENHFIVIKKSKMHNNQLLSN